MGLTMSHQLFHMDPHSWWSNNKKSHHHRAEMLPGCGWAIHGGDCLPRKRRVYGEEAWRGQISLPASQGE